VPHLAPTSAIRFDASMSAEAGTAEAARRTRPPITMGLGAVILIVALVFAFNSIYGHWYALFRHVHVATVVFWVGGGLMITVLALLADRRHDAAELATLARQAAFVGEKLVAPAGWWCCCPGVAMMLNTDWGWGQFWVEAGLVGFASTFVTGVAILGPLAKKIHALVESQGPTAPPPRRRSGASC
jgi:uncharacterized membrane protein